MRTKSQSLKVSKSKRTASGWAAASFETLRLCAFATCLLIATPLFACPVCWGSPDDPMVKSANNGIWVLLGVVGFVQIGFAALFISFWRRARDQKRFRESLHVIHPFDKGGPLS
jgi:hypothetical protein